MLLLAAEQNAGDQKTAEDEEDVHAHPEQGNLKAMVDDDRKDSDSAEAVELLDSAPMTDGWLDGRSCENLVGQIEGSTKQLTTVRAQRRIPVQ
jgi:hypothetical protein